MWNAASAVGRERTRSARSPARPARAPAIELLVIEDCPNAGPTARLVHEILASLGRGDVDVPVEVIRDRERAEQRSFIGSPTVLVGGVDPFGVPGAPAAVACRVFRTPDGRLARLPDRAALTTAIAAYLASGEAKAR